MDEVQCCPYGPCGDATSGANSSADAAKRPWQTEDAQQIQGGFGDQFHQFLQTSDLLKVREAATFLRATCS